MSFNERSEYNEQSEGKGMSENHEPYNYKTAHWAPLKKLVQAMGLPVSACGEWMWMEEDPQGIHAYKHCDSRWYIRLDEYNPVTERAKREFDQARKGLNDTYFHEYGANT